MSCLVVKGLIRVHSLVLIVQSNLFIGWIMKNIYPLRRICIKEFSQLTQRGILMAVTGLLELHRLITSLKTGQLSLTNK